VLVTSLGEINSSGNVSILGSSFTNLGGTGSYGFALGQAIHVQSDGLSNQILAAGSINLQGTVIAPTADIKLLGNTETTAGGLFVLSQNGIELAGQHSTVGGSIELTGDLTLSGNTDLDADDQNVVIFSTVNGAFQLNISAGSGDVIFWEEGGGLAPLTGLTVSDSGSVYFDNGFHASTISVASAGLISAFGTLTAFSGSFSSSTGDIDLDVGAHAIDSLSFSAPGQTVGYVGQNTFSVTLAEADTLNLTSNTGDITDSGNWDVDTLMLTAANGTAFLGLDDDASSPMMATYATQGLDITTAFAYTFDALNYGGNLTLNAGGTVTQTGLVDVVGDFVINAPGQTVDLGTFTNSFGSFRADASAVTVQTSNPLVLSGGTYDTLDIVANGALTQTAAITVNTALSINSQGSILLTNAGNKITSLGTVSALLDIDIFEDPGFDINGPVTAGGDITIGTNGGDLTLNSSILSLGGGFITVYTDLGSNVINNVGASVFGGSQYAVYSSTDSFLGGLTFDQTISAPTYPQPAAGPGQNSLVLFAANNPPEPPSLDNLDNTPPINDPAQGGDVIVGDEADGGGLEGGGFIQTAYGDQESADFIDNGDGVIGLDSFGNSQQITDIKIITLLKGALDDQAQQDLLSAIGISLDEFNAAAEGNLVTPGEVFDLSDLSSGSLATAPLALQQALSDQAKAELEAILGEIFEQQGNLDGVIISIGQAFDMASGKRLPQVPPILVISLSSIARLELERALAP
jgi:hypothetical protein